MSENTKKEHAAEAVKQLKNASSHASKAASHLRTIKDKKREEEVAEICRNAYEKAREIEKLVDPQGNG